MACAGSAKKTSRSACRCVPRTNWAGWRKGFNTMAGHLESLYTTLEERVDDKTHRSQQKQGTGNSVRGCAFRARQPMLIPLCRGFSTACKSRWGKRRLGAPARRKRGESLHYRRFLPRHRFPAIAKRCCPVESVCAARRPPARLRWSQYRGEQTPACPRHRRLAGFQAAATSVSVGKKPMAFPVLQTGRYLGRIRAQNCSRRSASNWEAQSTICVCGRVTANWRYRTSATCWRNELHDSIAQGLAFLNIQLQLPKSRSTATTTQMRSTLKRSGAALTRATMTCANCWCISVRASTRGISTAR